MPPLPKGRGTVEDGGGILELNGWRNGRTQFAPTIGFFVIVLKSPPQQTPPLPKGRGTVEDGGGILEFNDRQKPKNPPVTFGDSPL